LMQPMQCFPIMPLPSAVRSTAFRLVRRAPQSSTALAGLWIRVAADCRLTLPSMCLAKDPLASVTIPVHSNDFRTKPMGLGRS